MHASRLVRRLALCSVLVLAVWPPPGRARDVHAQAAKPRRMSLANRILLNRAAIAGLRDLEVMLIVALEQHAGVTAQVETLGGRVSKTAPEVGYLRVSVPTERLLTLLTDERIDAYQISSLSRSAWYRDGPMQIYVEENRRSQHAALPATPAPRKPELPLLTVERSRSVEYTAGDEAGVDRWLANHPTYDGRGVTIAIVETARPEFRHPTLRGAKALDGTDVPKIAGILNLLEDDAPDDTRVALDVEVRALGTWAWIDGRIYTLPRPGTYSFGLLVTPAGPSLAHRFAVIRERSTNEILVDTDGDTDFQDETPIADISERIDVRDLKLVQPHAADVSFIMRRGSTPDIVHLHVARNGHEAMSIGVAAGSKSDDGLAYGVAPNARVVLTRASGPSYHVRTILEGFLEASRHPDVDVVGASTGIMLAPDTAADFVGLFMHRVVAAHGKPIFQGAGNDHLEINSVTAMGGIFSVGASQELRTFAAFHGGGTFDGPIVHPFSAAGPSIDGALKPDFLAPMERLAASTWSASGLKLPENAPKVELPPGYQISCCTSASGPYGAGIGALLVSAAKQAGVDYSLDRLARALRAGARYLSNFPANQQGSGVLDVNAAWRELTRAVEIPRIRARSTIVHPMAMYAARGFEGEGLFEFGNWSAGTKGRREIHFLRESGPARAVTYRVSWTGSDGTFTTADRIALPRATAVTLPVGITVASPGIHTAILNLHDPASDAIVFRTQATIVAPERIDDRTHTLRRTGVVGHLRNVAHYFLVPAGVPAMTLNVEIKRGTLNTGIIPGFGLAYHYYNNVFPLPTRPYAKGKHSVVLPNSVPGTWSVDFRHRSTFSNQGDTSIVDGGEAEYEFTVTLLEAALQARRADSEHLAVDVENRRGELREPVIDVSRASVRTHTGALLSTGLPNLFDIDVPQGAATLDLRLRADPTTGPGVELFLYDCTSGDCFLHNNAFPAAPAQRLVARAPKQGRWVAAVNTAPFATASGGFTLEEVIAMPGQRHTPSANVRRPPGARWSQTLPLGSLAQRTGATNVLLVELIDLAVQRDEERHVWETRPQIPRFRDRPTAIGSVVVR